ncbi:luciferase family oxidoreductase group 1 [Streptomyces sp. CG 926]|uniref:LLM class flavin-dependent oxidoreductase n=1 Tax=Streptomyces sp. CG 926 TaxID=1882405 RepID=UPI000D6C2331|nr:LLM class flavin-dependent oxidoreductase [Streptomyces sp. CG 926]PWK69549.1 luciferase family oxidoreductase group 1 [Streptomyces sp. CG 926]
MTKLRLSVLDQTPVGEDHTPDQALRASVDLARSAEGLGYTRYWVAEHHDSPGFASSAPEILAGTLLAHTSRMRIGTGGVLLPRYDPAKVAEVFGVLASLHPGRVDLGIGRAGGPARDFPQRLAGLRALLGEGGVVPHAPVPPQMWLLGAGRESARLAGLLGTEFAFGHFFSPTGGQEAFEDYRAQFRTSTGARPGGALAVRVVTADSAARAEELAQSLLLWRARKDLGEDGPLPSYETTRRHRWTGAELERAKVHRTALVSGAPEQVAAVLTALAGSHGVDELIINTLTCDPADRRRSYELLSEAFALQASEPHSAAPVAAASGPALQGQERSRPQVWSA